MQTLLRYFDVDPMQNKWGAERFTDVQQGLLAPHAIFAAVAIRHLSGGCTKDGTQS